MTLIEKVARLQWERDKLRAESGNEAFASWDYIKPIYMNDAKDDIAVVLREMAKWANEPGEWTVVSDYARENGIKLDE